MKIKELLQKLKKLMECDPVNRDFEFSAKLEDHKISDGNVYRLHYINYHRIAETSGRLFNMGVIDDYCNPFLLPSGMSREDAFKVLSYLTDYIEDYFNLEPCSWSSVSLLDKAIDLKRLGFTRINMKVDEDSDVIDLFTIDGRVLLFKFSKYYLKYFEWYTPGVTFEEVKSIYAGIGIEFYDLIYKEDEKKRKEQGRVLEKKD